MTARKKREMSREIEGEVFFRNVDPHVGRFELEDHRLIVSNRTFDVPASIFPPDFELSKYEVSGKYKIEISIKEK